MQIIKNLTLTCALLIACSASAETTVDSEHVHAYAANAGWMNTAGDTTHGLQVSTSYCAGFVWSPTCGWISLGNGPTNGWRYTNNSATDWGVNHDGLGGLTGYAYGANIGWITFENTFGKPRLDLRTGVMSGSAWSCNIGWIGFSNTVAFVQMNRFETGPDADEDGIGDPWEYQTAGTLTVLNGSSSDADGDNTSDADEFLAGTNPLDDSDFLHISEFLKIGQSDQVSWPTQPTRLYRIEHTDQLGPSANWSDSGLGVIPGNNQGELVRLFPSPSPSTGFYRIKALLPFTTH